MRACTVTPRIPTRLSILFAALGVIANVACSGEPGASEPVLEADGGVEVDAAPDGGDAAPAEAQADSGWAATQPPCGSPGAFRDCPVPGWQDRPYAVYLPTSVDTNEMTPVVLMFHGGSGNAESGIDTSCPQGDRTHPACLHQVAEREGFAVVYPNGTEVPDKPGRREFNAGGGGGEWQCVGGSACEKDVDDIGYVTALLDDLERWLHVDRDAVFGTGLSNGAAFCHRLACELSDRIAAIAPVGGANQHAAVEPCSPPEPVAVLHVHGSADPCWTYEESASTCLGVSIDKRVGAEPSTNDWAARNGCIVDATTTEEADTDDDGIYTVRMAWSACTAPVRLLHIEGGGHTYPNGRQYLPVKLVGATSRDWGSERIWAFFEANRRD